MDGEQSTEFNGIDNQMVEEAIKRDCGVCKHLYHGTKKYIAYLIKEANEINIGSEIGYLGNGFYCYLFDAEASRIYAKNKYKKDSDGKIAVLNLIVNLGNTFFVYPELHKVFLNNADKLTSRAALRKKVGALIELFIEKTIIPDYDLDIDTVAQNDIYDKKGIHRPVFMYSIRDKKMVKDIKVYWEE